MYSTFITLRPEIEKECIYAGNSSVPFVSNRRFLKFQPFGIMFTVKQFHSENNSKWLELQKTICLYLNSDRIFIR